MKLRHQRLLYITFFLIFFITAPLLAFYAAGYRYNFTKKTFEKTGILVVDALPHGAAVYLNGRPVAATPARLTALLPQTYQVRVTKEGYSTWEKDVLVESNLTTFNKNIVLFKKTLPVLAMEGQINLLSVSPDHQTMVYSLVANGKETIRLRALTGGVDTALPTLNQPGGSRLEFVAWSPSQKIALLRQTLGDFNRYLIIDTETAKIRELFDLTRLNFTTVKWDQKNDDLLYGLDASALFQVNLVTGSTSTITTGPPDDFIVQGRDLYSITTGVKESFLNHATLGGEPPITEKIKLPSPSHFTLQPAPDGLLALLDLKTSDLFLIKVTAFADREIEPSVLLQAKAKALAWSNDQSKLLFYTDFEIWAYDLSHDQKQFINRLGQVIKEAFWYPQNNYVVYQVDNTLRATETEDTSFKNDTELTTFETIGQSGLDSPGATLYFAGQVGNQQGLYQLTVQ